MTAEVDPRLMNVLQGSMGLMDALRDAGVHGEVNVSLGREDGLLLLRLIAGSSDPRAEDLSQRGRPRKAGLNSLKVAGLTFEWPQDQASVSRAAAALVNAAPAALAPPANDNRRDFRRFGARGFEEETPALR